jgi:hypothetical protein
VPVIVLTVMDGPPVTVLETVATLTLVAPKLDKTTLPL